MLLFSSPGVTIPRMIALAINSPAWPLLSPALIEPARTAALLLLFGVLGLIAVASSRTADRLGVPAVLVLLILGMLAGREGFGGVAFNDYHFAFRLGTVALILILFEGGFNTSPGTLRSSLAPAALLATVGVALTAGIVAALAYLFGLDVSESLLIGAVVSSTDTAAVFAVLRGGSLRLQPRMSRLIELESCLNDPMAVILTTSVVAVLEHHHPIWWKLFADVPLQLLIGSVVGAALGVAARTALRRLRLASTGLLPAFTLAAAFASFGAATLAGGSGFLAVYMTGLMMDAQSLPFKNGLARVHAALGWLGQIGMFLMLGLMVRPSELLQVAGIGVALAVLLAVAARPLAVAACLLPIGYSTKETAFIGWVGLRGAVPVILATFPVMAHLPGAQRIFNIVFFVVVVNTLFPGATIRWVTRRMGFVADEKPAPDAVLEINSPRPLSGEVKSFLIEPSVAVCGARLRDIEFPQAAAVMLIVRNDDLLAPRGETVFQPGDHVYVFFNRSDQPMMDLLFGRSEDAG